MSISVIRLCRCLWCWHPLPELELVLYWSMARGAEQSRAGVMGTVSLLLNDANRFKGEIIMCSACVRCHSWAALLMTQESGQTRRLGLKASRPPLTSISINKYLILTWLTVLTIQLQQFNSRIQEWSPSAILPAQWFIVDSEEINAVRYCHYEFPRLQQNIYRG